MARRPGIIYIWRLSARYGWDASSTPSSLIYQVALLLLVIHPRRHLVNIFRTNLPPCRLFSWPSFYPPPSPPIYPLPWLPGHPPPWPICHTPFRPLHHRLEICQKNYTTGFFGQKFYKLKLRKLRLFFLLKKKHLKCINISYFSRFFLEFTWVCRIFTVLVQNHTWCV